MTPSASTLAPEGRRVIAHLRELAELTADANGAQRLAWGPVWRQARDWFRTKVAELELPVTTDPAGNNWVTLQGQSQQSLIVGSHLDSVPNGGWLDGSLGVLAGLEVLRRFADGGPPPLTIRLVDWADEEGARFGRSLLGSSAASGTLVPDRVRSLVDKSGARLPDVLRENGVELDRMLDSQKHLQACNGRAYLELHIEQGPVLATLGKPLGVVLGTFGLERHSIRFTGQAAHAGSTPISLRRDAFLAAAELALECREIARRHSRPDAGVVCTVGKVRLEPDIVTAVPGVAIIALDQRGLDGSVLAAMVREAQQASETIARANHVSVAWENLFRAAPRPFDPALIRLAEEAVRAVTGAAPKLPSGPLHDATEMARLIPTVMLFVVSPNGLSHCKEEDTPEEHLAAAVRAFLLLAEKTIAYLAASAETR